MGTWDMSEMDADNNGSLSFEEFAEGNQKKLKRGFDMIDANKDGRISTEEWDAFLDVHNMKTS
jgi:Ca2+-binding EF-hand superfamily protein